MALLKATLSGWPFFWPEICSQSLRESFGAANTDQNQPLNPIDWVLELMLKKSVTIFGSILVLLQIVISLSAKAYELPAPSVLLAPSPLNSHRPELEKESVKYIVLHTTESPYPSCYIKLKARGEAHFLVRQSGVIDQFIYLDRLARHAGRSEWKGKKSVDHESIGIEIEGVHNIPPNLAQQAALKSLVPWLQKKFKIRSENVLTHSMVAYGKPNRFWSQDHRGRKRCGMMLQRNDLRFNIGLKRRAQNDLDVIENRLMIADEPLFAFLYNPKVGPEIFSLKSGPSIRSYLLPLNLPQTAYFRQFAVPSPTVEPSETATSAEDAGTVEFIDADAFAGDGARAIGDQYAASTTIYFFARGTIRTGAELEATKFPADPRALPKQTKILVGYIYGGKVTEHRSAFSIANKFWNDPSTFYRFPDHSIKTGDEVNQSSIKIGTIVLFQR